MTTEPAVSDRVAADAVSSTPGGDPLALLLLRLLAAGSLAVSAWIHLRLALDLGLTGTPVTLSQLFVAEVAVSVLVAVGLLLRDRDVVWWAAIAVSVGGVTAILASVYFPVPAIGPFPAIDEPIWFFDKVACALAQGAVPVLWLVRRIAPPGR